MLSFSVVFLTLALLPLPQVNRDYWADHSLRFILDHAHQNGLQFGSQIVNTYGPLGFLVFPLYSPYAPDSRLLAEFALAFFTALGLWLLCSRLDGWPKWVLAGAK